MTWLDEMNALQTRLVEASPVMIGDELFNAMRLFRTAHSEIIGKGSSTIHKSPYWARADLVMIPPVNHNIVNYIMMREVAEREGVPITWLMMLPYKAQIDDAARYIHFTDDQIMYVDEEGNATPNCLIAYHDGVEASLIDEDEPFIFANNDFTNAYLQSTEQVIQQMADEQGLTKEAVLLHLSPNHIDAPFPYENDDSPWGDA
jgi:hypothetical protein